MQDRVLGGLEQRDNRRQPGRGVGRHGPASDEPAHDRDLAASRPAHGPRSIGRHERLDSIPDHQAGASRSDASSLWLASGSATAQRVWSGKRARPRPGSA